MQKTFMLFLVIVQFGCSSDYYYKNHQKISLLPVTKQVNIPTQIRYYKNTNGIQMGITDKILMKLLSEKSIAPYLVKYHLRLIKQLGSNLYLVATDSVEKTLSTANALHQEKGIVYAHPDFIKLRVLR